jgi:hypothetical protein
MITDILRECSQRGIEISPVGDRLKVGPVDRLTRNLLSDIHENKQILLALLNVIEVFDGTLIEESRTLN